MQAATRGGVIFLCLFLSVVIGWAVSHPQRRDGAAAKTVGYRVDLNTAEAATLELLPGVGPSIAKRIVQTRQGGEVFAGPDDLQRVRYVGPRLLQRIDAWVTYGGGSVESVAVGE